MYMLHGLKNFGKYKVCDITLQEIAKAIGNLKNGKSAGVDNVKAEMIKCIGHKGRKILHKIINIISTEVLWIISFP